MKLTKEDVGKKFTKEGWYRVTLLFVGDTCGFFRGESGVEYRFHLDENWIPYEELKKTVRKAPALLIVQGEHRLSNYLYTSEDEAKKGCEYDFVKWPANDTMWVDVEI